MPGKHRSWGPIEGMPQVQRTRIVVMLEPSMSEELKGMAARELRSCSNMATVLIKEALIARQEKT